MSYNIPTVTDADCHYLIQQLEQAGAWGIERKRLDHLFNDDRKGRAVVAECRERGLACIVSKVKNPAGNIVYRLAQSEEEWRAFRESELNRRDSIDKAVRGMELAWARGGVSVPQKGLF